MKRDWLSRMRRLQGLSMERVARDLGVSLRNVARWEHGESEPRPYHRIALARLLGPEVLAHLYEDAMAEYVAQTEQAS